jgi:ketosteroid isomerase-like protein
MTRFAHTMRPLAALFTAALLLPGITLAADKSPTDVVNDFNAAINARNVEAVAAELAEGGSQFTLRPAHPGMPANMPLTGDIVATWRTVGAVLFSTTESYRRDLEITSVIEDGDIASIWADATTTTVRKAGDEPMILNFSELYVLIKRDGDWKIGAYLDNRAIDTIAVGPDND